MNRCYTLNILLSGLLVLSVNAAPQTLDIFNARVFVGRSSPVPAKQTATDPCGGQIAFDSLRVGGNNLYDIYLMNSDGSAPVNLTNHVANEGEPSWSPDGSKIAFQSDRDNIESGRPDIYVMDADGGNVTRLTTNPAFDESPEWSPDGGRLAFITTRDDPNNNIRQLYLMNSDGSGQTRLTFGDSIQPTLTWSPDSSKIAFSAPVGGALPPDILRIYTISSAGGPVSPLTTVTVPEADIQPAWSPDGLQVAFVRTLSGQNGSPEIYVVDADTSNLRRLTNNSVDDIQPAWSPDGSAIAFVSSRDGNREIYLMYPDGSGESNLTNNSAHDDGPAWRPQQSAAPCLMTEAATDRAVALDSVSLTRDPFTVTTANNFSQDGRRRIALFARNIKLLPGDNAEVVTAQAEDAQHNIIPLQVEFVGRSTTFSWLTQVNVKLSEELDSAGDVRVSITLRGFESNKALVSIVPEQ